MPVWLCCRDPNQDWTLSCGERWIWNVDETSNTKPSKKKRKCASFSAILDKFSTVIAPGNPYNWSVCKQTSISLILEESWHIDFVCACACTSHFICYSEGEGSTLYPHAEGRGALLDVVFSTNPRDRSEGKDLFTIESQSCISRAKKLPAVTG